MVTQRELGRRFAAGYDPSEIGDASNVSVEPCAVEGYDALIRGYGHAVYALRFDGGDVCIFEGWRDYSKSTACQLTKIGDGVDNCLIAGKHVDADARPSSKAQYDDIEDVIAAAQP